MSIPQLLARSLAHFPPWLKLVATTRRDDRVVPLFALSEQCFLGNSVAAQRVDLRQYIERRCADPQLRGALGRDETACRRAVAGLAERSAGNFQYAETVLGELGSGKLAADAIDHLPAELVALYFELAESRFPDRLDFAPARIVLSVMLAARQALTREDLALVTGLDPDDALLPTIDKLSCFVTWDTGAGDERVYRMAHKSISDWLIGPPAKADRFKVDPAPGRDLILAHCRNWATHHEPYALTHLMGHLLEADLRMEALAVVRDGFFSKRRSWVDPRHDLDDTRELTLALVGNKDQPAILELAQTDNLWQRDGVAAGLQAAPPSDNDFVDHIVAALLQVR
jgi:hypothetical protein